MAEVKIYTTNYCPYCKKAKDLLNAKHVEYEEIDVTNNPDLRTELTQMTGRTTVPQIFINGKHIGGYTDLERLNLAGTLNMMLGEGQPKNWGRDVA